MPKKLKKGQLIVISGPSGAGKSTVITEVRRERKTLTFSISYTTRPPRQGEEDHVQYHFVDRPTFERMIAEGKFLEYATYEGNYYGTAKQDVEELTEAGYDVLLDIDVQGGASVRKACPDDAISIFVIPPSFHELSRRLYGRKSESDEVIQGRLRRAREEYKEIPNYDYLVVNDQVAKAAEEILAILKAQDCRVSARLDMIKEDISL